MSFRPNAETGFRRADPSRRRFLKTTAAGLCLPAFLPGRALGLGEAAAPSDRITIGCIGVGNMGNGNLDAFLAMKDVAVVAVCDVDALHLEQTAGKVNRAYGGGGCSAYRDFRDLIARPDIDAVSLATPDHWHSIPAVAAAASGKDVYGEKPLSHTLGEGRRIRDAMFRHGRVWQTGSWQRSEPDFRFACELVRNGRIGTVRRVEVGLPSGFSIREPASVRHAAADPPDTLDYEFWLGPAPFTPYFPGRTHWNWRWNLDTGGGQLLDWVGHHVDIAHWGLGMDLDAPVSVEGAGEFPSGGPWNAASRYRILTRYANGIEMVIAGGHEDIRGGTKWIGDLGWVWVTRGGLDAHPGSLLAEKIGPGDVRLVCSTDHHRNFIDCVRSRARTVAPADVAHRSATPGHLGLISMRLGRPLRFDPESERILGDAEASRLLDKPMRPPWSL